MAKAIISREIMVSIEKYIEKIRQYYEIEAIILFGSYAKGTENEDSDIDIAIIINSNENTFDLLVELMMHTQNIDLRIEPHPIKFQDFKEGNPFVQEILDTGLKVA